MSPRADHADTIIAVADVRCRRSSQDHHIAAGRDGQAGQQPGAPGETDAYPEPGTTTGTTATRRCPYPGALSPCSACRSSPRERLDSTIMP